MCTQHTSSQSLYHKKWQKKVVLTFLWTHNPQWWEKGGVSVCGKLIWVLRRYSWILHVSLHLVVFMFLTCPLDHAYVQISRGVSGTHLLLPTTTCFYNLSRAHTYNIEKNLEWRQKKVDSGVVLALETILVSWYPCALGDKWVEFRGMVLTYFA